ncbi:baseplate hub protein [Proteus mirabilis]|uniref:baseplate hub protein n=2 Tax=Proteus mirabilis TaxID=584 RepID=UPI0024E1234D|nr:hypothetical protein [Proteus mirabilis]HEK1906989.1 hypothetical protein [Proteus mirabilis]
MDLRRIRLGIEVGERLQWYEGLRISASGTKYANPLQNECNVTISGLNAQTRDYLLTETSPYNNNKQTRRLYLEAGRVNTGLLSLFIGDIVSAEIDSPPDVTLTLSAKTSHQSAGKIISSSGGTMRRLSEIALAIADDCGVKLDFQATDKNIANWYYCGSALHQIERLQEAGDVKAFIDDDTLFVKDDDKALKSRLRILNMNSGMIGIPKATESGLTVSYLIDSTSELGGMLRLESKLNPSLNGDYIIEQLAFSVASHEADFNYTAICKRA